MKQLHEIESRPENIRAANFAMSPNLTGRGCCRFGNDGAGLVRWTRAESQIHLTGRASAAKGQGVISALAFAFFTEPQSLQAIRRRRHRACVRHGIQPQIYSTKYPCMKDRWRAPARGHRVRRVRQAAVRARL